MVLAIQNAPKKVVIGQGADWELLLSCVLYSHHRRLLKTNTSPFKIIFGLMPLMNLSDPPSLVANASNVPIIIARRAIIIGMQVRFSINSVDEWE